MKLARNGHLSDLTMERIVAGETMSKEISTHVESCDICREAMAQMRLPVEVPKMFHSVERSGEPEASVTVPRMTAPKIGLFAVALLGVGIAAMVVLNRTSTQTTADGVRLKGAPYSVTLYAKSSGETRPLRTGALVAGGDRVGFQLENREEGYLAIVGIDATADTYPCYPQQSDQAAFVKPSTLRTLPEAIRFDHKPGRERIVTIWCSEAFEMSDVQRKLKLAQEKNGVLEVVLPGCLQSEVILVKD